MQQTDTRRVAGLEFAIESLRERQQPSRLAHRACCSQGRALAAMAEVLANGNGPVVVPTTGGKPAQNGLKAKLSQAEKRRQRRKEQKAAKQTARHALLAGDQPGIAQGLSTARRWSLACCVLGIAAADGCGAACRPEENGTAEPSRARPAAEVSALSEGSGKDAGSGAAGRRWLLVQEEEEVEYEYVSAPREYEGLAQADEEPAANGDAEPSAAAASSSAPSGFVPAGARADEDQPSTGVTQK